MVCLAKSEKKNINIDFPIEETKDNLIKNIQKSNKFTLQNIMFDNNEYTILIDGEKSAKSGKGESIEVKIKDINGLYSFIHIKSELKSRIQQYDWNINNENIDMIESFLRNSYEYEANPGTENEKAIMGKYKSYAEKIKSQLASVPCMYYGGHENLTNEAQGTLNVYPDKLEFVIIRKQFEIPISSIINNEIMHQEQITQRLTATRMVLLGGFSLAAPKKKTNVSNYLTIEYEDRGVRSMLIFKGVSSFLKTENNATIELNAAIIKARKKSYIE